MSGTKSLDKAVREARIAAERAREFADLYDEYADCLPQEEAKERASQLRLKGRSKLAEIREAMSDSDDWARMNEWEAETKMFDVAPATS